MVTELVKPLTKHLENRQTNLFVPGERFAKAEAGDQILDELARSTEKGEHR
jgi:hypothetical protein